MVHLICFILKKPSREKQSESFEDTSLSCRFVIDGFGIRIGESITVYNDLLIVKAGKVYLGIPLKHTELQGKKIVVKGLIDQVKAKELGESWRSTVYREIEQPSEETHEC